MRKGLMVMLAGMAAACTGNLDRLEDDQEPAADRANDALSASAGGLEDTYVTTSFATAPRGARAELKVGTTSSASQHAYLKFTVSGIPSGATNIKATLKVKANTSVTSPIEAHLSKSTSWSESTLVLAGAPGAQSAVLSKIAATTAGAWSSFDVSSGVNGNGVVSFVLTVPSGAIAEFASKEAGAASAPALSVEYTPAPTLTPTLFGAGYNPHTNANYDVLAKAWGPLEVVRTFDNGKGTSAFFAAQPDDIAHGAVSHYSFKYLPKDILAGKHDADLKAFFNGIEDNHPVYWTYFHEPDDEIFKTQAFTAPDYRAAWAYIKNVYKAIKTGRPNLRAYATTIFMEYSMRPTIAPSRPLTGANGMYPGDDVIDVFGVDAYNDRSAGGLYDPAEQFDKIIDFAKAHGKPWAIGEIGSCPSATNPNLRAQYLTNAIKHWKKRASTPVFAAYFNVDWSASTCDYRMENDAAASAVWRDAIANGYKNF